TVTPGHLTPRHLAHIMTGFATNSRSPPELAVYAPFRRSFVLPRVVRVMREDVMVPPFWISTSPSRTASSQIGIRGQVLRHASFPVGPRAVCHIGKELQCQRRRSGLLRGFSALGTYLHMVKIRLSPVLRSILAIASKSCVNCGP